MGRDITEREYRTRERLLRDGRLCAWEPSKAHRATYRVTLVLDSGQEVPMALCGKHTEATAVGGTNFKTLSVHEY